MSRMLLILSIVIEREVIYRGDVKRYREIQGDKWGFILRGIVKY